MAAQSFALDTQTSHMILFFPLICLKEDYLRPPEKRNIFDIHAYSLGKEKGVCVCSERKVSVFCKEEKVFAIMV